MTHTFAAGDAVTFRTMRGTDIRNGIFVSTKPSARGDFVVIRAEDNVELTTRPSLVNPA